MPMNNTKVKTKATRQTSSYPYFVRLKYSVGVIL